MWGTGLQLSNDHALFEQNWHSDGFMAEVYKVVRVMLKLQASNIHHTSLFTMNFLLNLITILQV